MRRVLMVVAMAAIAVGCQTITEEMPSRPNPILAVGGGGGQVPIVVVPVPIPSPQPAPAPNPAPAPTPRPNPAPDPGPGIPPNIPNNNSPVTKVAAKVYFVECNGSMVPNSEHASEADIGCRIHMDCTPKDDRNAPTQARGTPQWSYSDPGLVYIGGNSPYNPVLTARGSGELSMSVTIDGVRSNTVSIQIR